MSIGSGSSAGWSTSKKEQWQNQMLIGPLPETNNKPITAMNKDARQGWRPYASRLVPFTLLCTPGNAVILQIDRFGSYSMALSSGLYHNNHNISCAEGDTSQSPAVVLTFYGIPSKAALEGNAKERVYAPLLQTVSLLYDEECALLNMTRHSYPHATFLTSSDAKLGVAYLRAHRDNPLGTMVLYALPHGQQEHQPVQSCRWTGIPMSSHKFTNRNLLWHVNTLPVQARKENLPVNNKSTHSSFICDSVLLCPGYLVCNDQGNGIRLIWVVDAAFRAKTADACLKPVQKLSSMDKCATIPTMVHVVNDTNNSDLHVSRTEQFNNRQTGEAVQSNGEFETGGLCIAFEAYLSISQVILNLLEGRPALKKRLFTGLPEGSVLPSDYYYNLLSVNNDGRTVDLVIVIPNNNGIGSVAVFVRVDIFTQHYHEVSWRNNPKKVALNELQEGCDLQALNYRMKQRKLGPYSVHPDDETNWGSFLCQEKDFSSGCDFEMERDLDPKHWKPFVDFAQLRGQANLQTLSDAFKTIPYSSLYPDCDMATNDSVYSLSPTARLSGRRSPLEILYR